MAQQSFILVSTAHGPMIASQFDYTPMGDNKFGLGPGLDLIMNGAYDLESIERMIEILTERRTTFGEGVVMVDGGANVGAITLSCARAIDPWGSVLSYEPQERIFYALCGNVALNNLYNVTLRNEALGDEKTFIEFPVPNYNRPGNLGGVSARMRDNIGQKTEHVMAVPMTPLDTLQLPRLDFLKLDVEGMELEALNGAAETIKRCRPHIMTEWFITGEKKLADFYICHGYEWKKIGLNIWAQP